MQSCPSLEYWLSLPSQVRLLGVKTVRRFEVPSGHLLPEVVRFLLHLDRRLEAPVGPGERGQAGPSGVQRQAGRPVLVGQPVR